MDERKRKDFHRLLSTLEAERELERDAERRRGIAANRAIRRFEQLAEEVLLPTLRELSADLEKKGHPTRLARPRPERVRLDVQLQVRVPRRCALELTVLGAEPGQVRVRRGAEWQPVEEESVPLDRLDAALLTDRLVRLLEAAATAEPPASRR